jgi:hypothetical protein
MEKMHNYELHGIYSSPNMVRMIKSMRLREVEHVAHMGQRRNIYRVLVGKPKN